MQRCGVFFSQTPNEAEASAVMTSTISNWQLTRQNSRKPRASRAQAARKPRASCAQAREAPARHLAMLSWMLLAARFKQWIGSRNTHCPSFRLCPSVWQSLLSFLLGQGCCHGATSAGRVFVGCCAIHTKTSQTEVNENEFLRHCARASPRKRRASAAQGPNPGQRNIGQAPFDSGPKQHLGKAGSCD